MTTHPLPPLSPLEARVLGVLIEKQLATPDYYPLTLNALLAGCNQKTSRHPVMSASEAEVRIALDSLRHHTLVIESFGASGRVMRYAHNVGKVLAVPTPSVALLAVLMLRGPQTVGELRTNCERLHGFTDLSTVEGYLDELAARSAGALVVKLARLPGAREARYAHLLSGAPEVEAYAVESAGEADIAAGELAALKAQVLQLHDELQHLRGLVERLYADLGVARE